MKATAPNRIERLLGTFTEPNIDTLLVLIAENRRYLSGFTAEDTGFDESAGALLISRNGKILATDSRFDLQATNETSGFDIFCYRKGLAKELPEMLQTLESRRVGIENRRVSCEQYDQISEHLKEAALDVEIVKTKDLVEQFRLCKEPEEIEAIRASLRIAESAFDRLLTGVTPGMTETEAAWQLEKNMREAGAEALSFPVIVAAGQNAALPHAIPTDRVIHEGEPLLFDWGARLNGYCSDISRTIILGKPDDVFEKVFNAVYDAQQKAIDAIKPGMQTKDVDAVAREHLREKELDQYFGHGLGHGVGLAIHEAPSLSPVAERSTEIKENMIFTVEPGVYIPDWGGVRLENMVAVTSNGAEVLNSLSVQL